MTMQRRKGPSGTSHQSVDDNEKGGKVKRQSQEKTKSTILVLVVFLILGFCALKVFPDSTDFDPLGPGGLRSKARSLLKRRGTGESLLKHPSLLPPDSVYNLKVDDCEGNKVDLEQFAGSVSLIVNVASH